MSAQLVDPQEFIEILDYNFKGDDSTLERKRAFLKAYRVHGVVSRATYEARIHRTTVYKWLEHDEGFAQAFADCHEDTYDELEASGYQKALAGDPILTMFYLKAHRPKFRDKLQVDLEVLDSEIRERLATLSPQLLPAITGYLGDGDSQQVVQNPSESDNQQKSE